MSVDDTLLERFVDEDGLIPINPHIPDCGMRVESVLAMLASGMTYREILAQNPSLQADDIRACITYAYRCVSGELILGRLVIR